MPCHLAGPWMSRCRGSQAHSLGQRWHHCEAGLHGTTWCCVLFRAHFDSYSQWQTFLVNSDQPCRRLGKTSWTRKLFKYCKDKSGLVKPVVIITVDGGPDENPRYKRVMPLPWNFSKTSTSTPYTFAPMHQDAVPLAGFNEEWLPSAELCMVSFFPMTTLVRTLIKKENSR